MERDITAIILETPKQAINDLLETEPGQQKQYKLAEAMTNRLNSGEFWAKSALLEALYLGLNKTEPKF